VKRMKKRLTVSCTALLVLALSAAPAPAAQVLPPHPSLFEIRGFVMEPGHIPFPPPEGEFEDACGVARDSEGDIYLSDYYHHVIDVYDASHTYITQIADPDPDGPCNLAVDAAGTLYVNHWHRNVVRFIPSEYPPTESTTYEEGAAIDSARSTGLALDPATGRIYVDDRTYVAVYESSGEPVLHEGQPLRIAQDPDASYYGVAVSDFAGTEGRVYLADAATGTVKAYDPEASLTDPLQTLTGAGTPQHGFVSLVDSNVAIDPTHGHLFVADNTEPGFEHPAAVVDEFNPAGEYRGQLTATILNDKTTQIVDAEPTALAVTAEGDIYVTSGNDEEAVLFGFGPTETAHSLTVSKSGVGEGTVTSKPAGIDCGVACAAEYNAGEEVTLTAVPDPGSTFAGWSGGCSGTQLCHIELVTDKAVVAEFEAAPAPLGLGPAIAQRTAAALAPASATSPSPANAHPSPQSHRHRHHRAHHTKAKGKARR